VGVINLPQAYDRESCLEWQASLRSRLRLPVLEAGSGPAAAFGRGLDEPVEAGDLSYLAVYHPWLRVFDPRGPGRLIPPDGAVCGLIAARERERAAWIAPANRPLAGALGLGTNFSEDDWTILFERGFNLVRSEASGFAPMSAHTLSADRSLLQVSVRRLLILLKKAAVNLGMDFAFESNHAVFREGVRAVLEELLGDLYERGAFAGNSRAAAFRVVTGEEVNPPESLDAGRFIVLIQVAPSQPMEFITVQLIRLSEGGLAAGEV
jgi:phage tail sheath protein FI